MTTVQDIHEFLKTLAPEDYAYDWDHVGLLCGRADRPVTKVLIALDPFAAACREAKEVGAELLLTHHPAIWSLSAVNDATEAGRNLLFLIENGIAALNAHTNLDRAPGGVNDCLAGRLGLTDVAVLHPDGTDAQGRDYGLVRVGRCAEMTPEAFAVHVRDALHCPGLRYAAGARPIRRVAVGGGACGGELEAVAASGCDAFVTADLKYNQFADAAALGLTLIDAGHFETENPVCEYLAAQVRAAFPEVEVRVSQRHGDCIRFLR